MKEYIFVLKFCHRKTPFLCKIPLLTQNPFFVIFAEPNTPDIADQGLTPAFVLHQSALGELVATRCKLKQSSLIGVTWGERVPCCGV